MSVLVVVVEAIGRLGDMALTRIWTTVAIFAKIVGGIFPQTNCFLKLLADKEKGKNNLILNNRWHDTLSFL